MDYKIKKNIVLKFEIKKKKKKKKKKRVGGGGGGGAALGLMLC